MCYVHSIFFLSPPALVLYDCSLPCNLCPAYSFWFISFTPVVSTGLKVQTSLLNYPPPRNNNLRQNSPFMYPHESLPIPAVSESFHQAFFCLRGHPHSDPYHHHLPNRLLVFRFCAFNPFLTPAPD